MNYENFRYDLDNVLRYYEHKFCLDQIVYTFNDKYNQLEKKWFTLNKEEKVWHAMQLMSKNKFSSIIYKSYRLYIIVFYFFA